MGVKFDHKPYGKLSTGCWGEYLNLREGKRHEAGEACIMKSFVICMLLQIMLGRSNKDYEIPGKDVRNSYIISVVYVGKIL
jgi:hypothetical protein